MSVDTSKITALVNALIAKFENKTANKKTDITGDYSQDVQSYPTVQAVKSWVSGGLDVQEQQTAESGFAKTYVVKFNNTQVGSKINIPKDYLVKSATVETCTTANVPVQGYNVGDKYLDFIVNTKDSSATAEHIYILVTDLVDAYSADNSTLELSSGNVFSIKNNGVPKAKLATAVQTSLGYADSWNSSAAKGITSTDIANWNAASGGITISDVDSEIDDYIDALITALSN